MGITTAESCRPEDGKILLRARRVGFRVEPVP
jgi:hypothetical protein